MNALALIDGLIAGDAAAFVIDNAIYEESVGQIRKQKPWLEPLIQHLRREKIADKYIPWITTVVERRETSVIDGLKSFKQGERSQDTPEAHWQWVWDFVFDSTDYRRGGFNTRSTPALVRTLVDLSRRFEEADKKKKWDKALKMGLLKNPRVKDIMFWSKPSVKVSLAPDADDTLYVLQLVLTRLERLQSRKDIKAEGADLIYRDDRFTVYSPRTHEASCQLGAGTRWCISGRGSDYWDDYTAQGKAFAFIMDAAGDEESYKIAAVYDLYHKKFESFFNAPDSSVRENYLERNLGKDAWSMIRAKIIDYMKDREPDIARGRDEFWAGDEVEFRMSAMEDRISEDITHYWLDSARFNFVDKETLGNDKLREYVYDAVYTVYNYAEGTIVEPTRTRPQDDDPQVHVKGTWGKDNTDWKEVLDEFFPIPPKPKNPLEKAGKQQWLPGMAKLVADDYQAAMNKWLVAQDPREEFKTEVVDSIKSWAGSEWDDSDVYIYDLRVTNEIDPEESIRQYGQV